MLTVVSYKQPKTDIAIYAFLCSINLLNFQRLLLNYEFSEHVFTQILMDFVFFFKPEITD